MALYSIAFDIPGLGYVDEVNAVWSCLPQVWFHMHLEVLAANMGLRSQQVLDILGGRVEDGGEVCRGTHDCEMRLENRNQGVKGFKRV